MLKKGNFAPTESLAQKCMKFNQYSQFVQGFEGEFEIDGNWPHIIGISGHEQAAIDFMVSHGVDENEAENWLAETLKVSKYPPSCSVLGCDENQIRECFRNIDEQKLLTVSPVRHIIHPVKKANFIISKALPAIINKTQNITPNFIKSLKLIEEHHPEEYKAIEATLKNAGIDITPKTNFLTVNAMLLEDKGFVLKEGRIVNINETKYARYILDNFWLAVTSGNRFYMYEDGIWKFADFEEKLSRILLEFLHRDVPDFWSSHIERKYYNGLKRLAPSVEFDTDKNFLNLTNGIYDIEQKKILPHSKYYYISIRIPIEYSPEAECPKFEKFLQEIFEGDKQLIDLIGEIMGYCLTSETKAQKAFLFYGSGSNGKSVLAEALSAMVGKQNVSSLSLTDLDKSFARAEIVGKTVNIATENEVEDSKLNTQHFKAIISGDSIRIEEKFKMGYTYKPIAKCVLCMNSLPYSRDQSHGFFRRLIIVPFNKQITEKEANKNLVNELLEELPGIFLFALKGLERLSNNNYIFTRSEAAEKALNEYRAELDPLFEFINQTIVKGETRPKLRRKEIKDAYVNFLLREGYKKVKELSDKRFWKLFREELNRRKIDFYEDKTNGERCFCGIKLYVEKPETEHNGLGVNCEPELAALFNDEN